MAKKEREPVKEDPPIGAPAWMLTFCDCMTLLLTFFVLLLSFSSFDESTKRRLEGAMKFKSFTTVDDSKARVDDSVAMQVEPLQDVTDKGAEKNRPPEDQKVVKNPRQARIRPETDAYNQETVLNIALDKLFMGDSHVLTASGRDGLSRVSAFLRLRSYYVIIGESSGDQGSSRSAASIDEGLRRSWIVLQFLHRRNPRPGRFWISGECPRPQYSKKNKATMQIVLLGRDITRTSGKG